ncbi:MAG: hypothetical protein KDJ73_00315 [Notoacmeibacter sp.]|nr:hypothetical protein [Notoacmeibacter sp.]MCC0033430.1 hypothetical protein [Brucellaceae bacterium]
MSTIRISPMVAAAALAASRQAGTRISATPLLEDSGLTKRATLHYAYNGAGDCVARAR